MGWTVGSARHHPSTTPLWLSGRERRSRSPQGRASPRLAAGMPGLPSVSALWPPWGWWVGVTLLIGGETGRAQEIALATAQATGELVDSLFGSSALDGIEFAVGDLGAPADPLSPAIHVDDLL